MYITFNCTLWVNVSFAKLSYAKVYQLITCGVKNMIIIDRVTLISVIASINCANDELKFFVLSLFITNVSNISS